MNTWGDRALARVSANSMVAPDKRKSTMRQRAASLGATTVLVLAAGLLVAPSATADTAPIEATVPETASADPLPTVQIDGVAWTQAVVGNTVYAGGEFESARPAGSAAGTNEIPRSNLLSYDLTTGELIEAWNPNLNGGVLASAASPDGTRLYIGGRFTSVDGENRYRLAAFDTATGQLISTWAPSANAVVQDIVATDTTVYITGEFSVVNGVARSKVAALSTDTGALLDFNADVAGGWGGRAVVVSPDESKIVIAGSFTSVNGSTNPGRGMAALDSITGASLPWAINSVIRNGGNSASVYSLASDGDSVYGTGYDYYGGDEDGFEGAFRADWNGGETVWIEDCHGDSYGVYSHQGVVYTASHAHYCGNIGEFPETNPKSVNHALAFDKNPSDSTITKDTQGYRSFEGETAGKLLDWYPKWVTGKATSSGQAGWDVVASGNYVLYAGEFTAVSGLKQQGLVRFGVGEAAPQKRGPNIKGGSYQITTQSFVPGTATIGWDANYDDDDALLTYEVLRRGVSQPLYTTTAESTYWVRPHMSFQDTTVTAGQSYDYRIRVTDPHGNSTVSDWTSVTVADQGSSNSYNAAVIADVPRHYWPLNEAAGTKAIDWTAGSDVTLAQNVVRGETGQMQGAASLASRFTGSGSGATSKAQAGPQTFTLEAWFQTTSTSGGKIVGFGDRATGNSAHYDRHIYLDGSGRISFGVSDDTVTTVTSDAGYNDGEWHQVVGSLGADGMTLFVDGQKVASLAEAVSAEAYNGFWRIGGDAVQGWPAAGSSGYFNGRIADVSVYSGVLTSEQVDAHWVASGRSSQIPGTPADVYGAAVYSLDPQLYWRLGEESGATATDSGSQGAQGTYLSTGSATLSYGETGALAEANDTAVRFTSSKGWWNNWDNRQSIVSKSQYSAPATYAIEGWFQTTSTSGGKLIGFGNSNGGGQNASSTYDRHIYMDASGRLKFGVDSDGNQVLTAPEIYSDGEWHHVVAQQSEAGMELFIDGELVAVNQVTSADSYYGYWRVGGDSTWEGDPFWAGTIDEVAVYGMPLTANQVLQHYQLGALGELNEAPTADFVGTVTDLSVAFDATASVDPEGELVDYTWDFGDGTSGTGMQATHAYAESGTYSVTLTLRDAAGMTAAVTKDVAVLAPNVVPTAVFTPSVEFLTLAVDASASADEDGTIASFDWDFGDGGTGTGPVMTHVYKAAGTYTVSLTVTDNRGGSAAASQDVIVEAQPEDVLAEDSFSRDIANGWGNADTGGAWTTSGGAAAFSVTDGVGNVALAPSHSRVAYLNEISSDQSITQLSVASSEAVVDGAVSATLAGRQVGADAYTGRLRFEPGGAVRLYLLKNQTPLGGNSYVLPGAYTPGEVLNIRLSVRGTSPTELAVKAWPASEEEPTAWQLQDSDDTASLQQAGTVSITSAMSALSTKSTVLSFDDYRLITGAVPTE